jgi:integrase
MATIAKVQSATKGVRYKAIVRRNGVILKTKTFATKTNARTWARRIENDAEAIEALDREGARLTFEALAREYLHQWNGKSRATPNKVAWWVARLGTRKLTDINSKLIQRHLDDFGNGKAERYNGSRANTQPIYRTLDRKRGPATYNRMRALISAVFKFAIARHYLTTNPVKNVPSKTENNKRVRYLSDDERKALLDAVRACQWPKLHLLVMLAITTGARQGELLGLRWTDIDFKAKTARLATTKNGEPRVLTLPTPAIEALTPFREVGGALVFPGKHPNKPFCFRKLSNEALVRAGIEDFRFHDLRHTAASYLAMNGATLFEIGEVLGHKSVETTKRYAHLSTEHKADLTERVMGGIFKEYRTVSEAELQRDLDRIRRSK